MYGRKIKRKLRSEFYNRFPSVRPGQCSGSGRNEQAPSRRYMPLQHLKELILVFLMLQSIKK
jgi:hypothetical protein